MMKLRSPRITLYCTLPEAAHSSLRLGPAPLAGPPPPLPLPVAASARPRRRRRGGRRGLLPRCPGASGASWATGRGCGSAGGRLARPGPGRWRRVAEHDALLVGLFTVGGQRREAGVEGRQHAGVVGGQAPGRPEQHGQMHRRRDRDGDDSCGHACGCGHRRIRPRRAEPSSRRACGSPCTSTRPAGEGQAPSTNQRTACG
jgi:hypothetical protein